MIASRPRSALLAASLLAALTLTSLARTASAGDGAAAAEVLFAEGKRLAQEGHYAAACPKLEESQKLDPGMGTLYRLGDCYEHVGRTASAWAAFLEVAASSKTSGQQARADDAKKRASDLEPNLAKLVIRVAEPDVSGLVVKRGEGRGRSGAVEHAAARRSRRARHRGLGTRSQDVARQCHRAGARVGADRGARARARSAGAARRRELAGHHRSQPADRDRPFGAQRTIAVVTAGAGLVALGIGGVFGIISMSKKSNANEHCDAGNTCDDDGLKLRHDAISAGNLSSVFFVAGGVLAATGAVLWLTAPSRSLRAGIAPRWAGLDFQMELP